MKKSFKILNKILSHPVVSTVVATILIGIGTQLLGWWPLITNAILAAWQFIFTPILIPLWLLALLSFSAVAIVIIIFVVVFHRETHSDYTSDEFYGVKWRWQYFDGGSLDEPVPFCVKCDFQLKPTFASSYSAVDHWVYRCENCGHVGADFRESISDFHDRVRRQIQRKLRSGEWAKEKHA